MGEISTKITHSESRHGNPIYTVYAVKCTAYANGELQSWVVYRRYSEFQSLHAALAKEPTITLRGVPKIPAKKMWGNRNPEVISERHLGLAAYLEAVLEDPNVQANDSMIKFLEADKRLQHAFSPPSSTPHGHDDLR